MVSIDRRALLRAALGASLVAACTGAGAVGWVGLLSKTPAEKFQDDDLRMFLETARDALNAEGPPKPFDWSNPKNGTGGSFLVLSDSVRNGMPCRRIRFYTYAPGYPNPPKASTTWTACKNAEGKWKLAEAK
ncbi:MAG TPA: RT0821/Lpp0805 family surface protein [Caldimonas sp.]|jgi:surface antigen|nr:RT0821/Lpp0805 family surface protein [Caldimonas sp.]HEX4232722.1 RT0821/Lpp0805 family surface protein [Caldimonas sp.]